MKTTLPELRTVKTHATFISIAVLLITLTLPWMAKAATATKAATGTDLTLAASWSGGSGPGFPTSADVATWNSSSLGAALTLASAASWGSISITAALTDISVTGAGVLTIASGINASTSANNITFANPIALSASQTWNINAAKSLTISGIISGTAFGLTKDSGTGTLNLANIANTFSGGVSVSAGTLQFGTLVNAQNYAFSGNALTINGGTLSLPGTSSSTVIQNYNFANLTGPISITGSTIAFSESNNTTQNFNGALSFSGNNIFTHAASGFSGHTVAFTKQITGSGTLTFNTSGAATARNYTISGSTSNSYTGTVVLNTAAASSSFVLSTALGATNYQINNGWILNNNGAGALNSANAVTLFNSTSVLTLTQPWTNTAAALTVTAGTVNVGNATSSIGNLSAAAGIIQGTGASSALTVNQTTDGTCAAVLTNTSGNTLSLIKTGSAKLTLTAANGYPGNTTISNGTLQVNGSLASASVIVCTNAILGGTGTLLGTTTVNAGGTVSPGGSAALTLNALTLGASASDNLTLTLNGNGTTVAGYVAVTGSGGFANNGTVTVNVVGSLPTTLTNYTLLTYSGTMAGTGTFVVGSLTSGLLGYVTNNTTASAIQLVVTGSDYLQWVGSSTNNWDLQGSNVWRFGSSGLPASYADTKRVSFDDSASNFVVNVAATVAPGGISVSNNANNYSLGGSGKITGGTSLTKDGTGTLTITTTNDYTAQTVIINGTLKLGDGTANNGNLASSISNNTALVFANPGSQTYAGVISGPGTVTKQSAGALTVSGNNSYDGLTTITGGTLVAGSSTALGSTNAGTVVTSGTLDVNGRNLGAEAVGISGQGVGNNGAVVNTGAAQTQALQSLTLNANSTIGGLSRWDVRGAGSLLNLNGLTLTKTGTNDIGVVQSTVSDGNIIINQGRLGFHAGTIFPAGAGQIAVNSSGILWIGDFGTPLQISQPVTLNGGTVQSDSGTTATLNSPINLTTNSFISAGVPTYLTNVISGTGLLTVSGTSTLVLDAPSNTWSGGLDIEAATVQLGNGDDNGNLPGSILVVTNNGLLAYDRLTDMAFSQAMVGTGGFKQAGPNIITMTNQQSYTGLTVLQAGTVLLAGGNNTLSNATHLSFTGNSTLNLDTNNQDVSGITINNTITGNIMGTGILNVIGTADLRLGSTGNTTPALNMSGLNTFGYNQPANVFSVGGQSATANSSGSANLALTNTITASRFGVAENGAYPGFTSAGTVNLGVNNVINANSVVIGYGNSANGGFAATGTLDYESGVSNPSLIIRNASGTGRASVVVGYVTVSDYSAGNGTVDLVTGVTGTSTLDALVGNLIIGQHNYVNANFSRSATGTFTMGSGILDATNIVLGQKTVNGGKTTSSAIGTFSLNGGTVKVSTMLIGDQAFANGPSVSGTFNLNSGILMAGAIQAGAGTASRTINWNDGTITNYDGATDLTIGTNLTVTLNGGGNPTIGIGAGRTATVGAVLNGSSSTLTKAGNGTLILSAANTCSGTTTINQGELMGVTGGSFPSVMALANTGILGVTVPDNTVNWACSGIICGAGSTSKLDFNFALALPSTSVAPLQVNGDVDFTAATPAVNISGGALIPVSTGDGYPLMTWTGTGPTSTNGMTLTLSARESCNLSIVGNTLYLVVSAITPAQLVWTGSNGVPWNSTVTNWLNGGSPDLYLPGDYVTFNDAAASFLVGITNNNVLPGGILFSNNTSAYTVTGTKAISGGTGLTKAGSASLTIGTANTYTGNTVISAGKLIMGNAAAIPSGAGNGNVTVNGTLDVAGFSPTLNNLAGSGTVDDVVAAGAPVVNANITAPSAFSGVIENTTGTLGLTKSGSDTLTLSGANTYAGTTTISSGTLSLAVNNNPLPIGTPLAITGAATLNVNGVSQTLTNITLADSITGTVNGGGTLNLSGGQSLIVGNVAAGGTSVLDLSGLAVFAFNGGATNLIVGGQLNSATASAAGTLTLATNSTLTANNLNLQTTTSGNGAVNSQINTGTLNLGLNTVLNVNTINAGTGGRDAGYIQYGSAVNNPTLTIRAADGIGRANVVMGAHTTVNGTTAAAAVDLTSNVSGNSTLDALINTLSVGNYSRGSGQTENASFLMGGGTLDATNIILGSMANNNGNNGALNSTFSLGGGKVKVGTLTMGNATASQGALTATFNLNSGIVQAKTIQAGASTATRAFNWNDGTITNYDGSTDLTIASSLTLTLSGGSPVFGVGAGRTATVNAVLAGSTTTLTKTGNGTLVLGGANSYSGDTAVSAGTLLVNNSIPSGTVTVATNAVLGGSGSVGSVATVQAGGSIQGGGVNGSNTLTVATLNLGTSSADTTYSRFTVTAGGTVAAASLNMSGTNIVNVLDLSLPIGTNTLFTYAGTIGGSSGFGGFKLGTLPAGTTAHLLDTGSAVQLGVTSVFTVNTNTPVLTNSISGNTLTLSWPADHLGWRLQVQTNTLNVGLNTNWFTWPNSTNATSVPITMNPAAPTVFFRLVYP